jgi:hypothetical protein
MQNWLWSILLVLMLLPTLGQTPDSAGQPAAVPTAAPPDAAPLDLVIAQVKAALDQYQKNLGSGPDALPPLASAEFDFKTTTATTGGVTVNLFIFKIGGSHEHDVVNDVTYSYSVPPPPKLPAGRKKPPTLTEALASTIQNAAAAVKTSGTVGNLKFSKLTVNIQYGVKWDGNIGASVPISFVTVGLSGDKNKNTVQSVKLVFGQ